MQPRTSIALLAALTLGLLTAGAGAAAAVEKCKAKVDSKTGLVLAYASGITSAAPTWGDAPGGSNSFFNPVCIDGPGGKLSGCLLADPNTALATVPPPNCQVCVNDGGSSCCARIKGCTPGARDCQTVKQSTSLAPGTLTQSLFVPCPQGYQVTGGGIRHTSPGFLLAFPHAVGVSTPNSTNDAWSCSAANDSASETTTLECSAICCRLP